MLSKLTEKPVRKVSCPFLRSPWDYGQHQMPEIDFGEAKDHYPVMSIDQLCEMPVKDWAEDDAVLFLWVTSPIIEKSFKLVHAWGFEYKAQFFGTKSITLWGTTTVCATNIC